MFATAQIYLELHFCLELHVKKPPTIIILLRRFGQLFSRACASILCMVQLTDVLAGSTCGVRETQ